MQQFEYAYDLSSAGRIRVWIPKSVDWSRMQQDGLKPCYGQLILSQILYRTASNDGHTFDTFVSLNSKKLQKLHHSYVKYLQWFERHLIIQVNRSYRTAKKGRSFSMGYRFHPAFVSKAEDVELATITDKRAVRAFKLFITSFQAEETTNISTPTTETTNIKDITTNTTSSNRDIEYRDIENRELYVGSSDTQGYVGSLNQEPEILSPSLRRQQREQQRLEQEFNRLFELDD